MSGKSVGFKSFTPARRGVAKSVRLAYEHIAGVFKQIEWVIGDPICLERFRQELEHQWMKDPLGTWKKYIVPLLPPAPTSTQTARRTGDDGTVYEMTVRQAADLLGTALLNRADDPPDSVNDDDSRSCEIGEIGEKVPETPEIDNDLQDIGL
ncbi:MAG: hypothetical protein ABFD89_16000 [Bryobacteraceae bacterium]